MTDPEIPYVTRETIQRELNYADNVRLNRKIDQKILQASRDIEALCHRRFYPWTGTHQFDMPDTDTLWLYDRELAEIDTIVSGDSEMTAADFIAQPASGPPYGWIDVNWGGSIGWEAGQSSWQRSISITGTFGFPARREPATSATATVAADATTLQLDSSAEAGVGSLLLMGSERLLITEKELTPSGALLTGDITANKGQNLVPVDEPDAVEVGELIMVGAERMYVNAIAGSDLVCARGEQSSTLAAHTTGDIVYVPRLATVQRGILGTTAEDHAADTPIYLLKPPSLVEEGVIALAVTALAQGAAAYGRVLGSTDNQREAGGRGAAALLERVYQAYGRKARSRAV